MYLREVLQANRAAKGTWRVKTLEEDWEDEVMEVDEASSPKVVVKTSVVGRNPRVVMSRLPSAEMTKLMAKAVALPLPVTPPRVTRKRTIVPKSVDKPVTTHGR